LFGNFKRFSLGEISKSFGIVLSLRFFYVSGWNVKLESLLAGGFQMTSVGIE